MHLNYLVSNRLSSILYLDGTSVLGEISFLNVKHQILQTIPHFPDSHSNFHHQSNRKVYFKAVSFASGEYDTKGYPTTVPFTFGVLG